MLLLAIAFYTSVASALVAVPVALVQGARFGKDDDLWGNAVRKTAWASVGLPFGLTGLASFLVIADMSGGLSDFARVPFLWLVVFGFSMVVLFPLSLFTFWLGKVIGRSKQ